LAAARHHRHQPGSPDGDRRRHRRRPRRPGHELAADNTGVGVSGDINVQNVGPLTIARNIDGLSGLTNAAVAGDILIDVVSNGTSGLLTIDANILAGTGAPATPTSR